MHGHGGSASGGLYRRTQADSRFSVLVRRLPSPQTAIWQRTIRSLIDDILRRRLSAVALHAFSIDDGGRLEARQLVPSPATAERRSLILTDKLDNTGTSLAVIC